MVMNKDQNDNEAYCFDFDPRSINWDDYFYNVHIPGVLKYMQTELHSTSKISRDVARLWNTTLLLYYLCNSGEYVLYYILLHSMNCINKLQMYNSM